MNRPDPQVARLDSAAPQAPAHAARFGVLSLRTPTLPPATETNTVFIGQHHSFIIDPATPHASERARLRAHLAELRLRDRAPSAIVLTHHHHDHVGAAGWLRDVEGLPVWAHRRTAELLPNLPIDRLLADGDVLAGSDESADRWQVLHTPGHASGHVALWEPERGTLIGGDLVASIGTIIVDPPDGHMATYLATLRRVRELGASTLVPAHGDPIPDPERTISEYLEHRAMREERILAALSATPRTLAELTERAYPELARALLPLAVRSALAHLQKLHEEGRALVGPGDEVLAPSARWSRA